MEEFVEKWVGVKWVVGFGEGYGGEDIVKCIVM